MKKKIKKDCLDCDMLFLCNRKTDKRIQRKLVREGKARDYCKFFKKIKAL